MRTVALSEWYLIANRTTKKIYIKKDNALMALLMLDLGDKEMLYHVMIKDEAKDVISRDRSKCHDAKIKTATKIDTLLLKGNYENNFDNEVYMNTANYCSINT